MVIYIHCTHTLYRTSATWKKDRGHLMLESRKTNGTIPSPHNTTRNKYSSEDSTLGIEMR
jgi:hypothetical protein